MPGGFFGDLYFQELSDLVEVAGVGAAKTLRQWFGDAALRFHHGPRALAYGDKARIGEDAYGFAYGAATHAELHHQFRFRGQFVSRLIDAQGYLLLQPADDGVGEGVAWWEVG